MDNVNSCELMKSIRANGALHGVLHHDENDVEILRRWLLDGAPLPNETLDESNLINIRSHQAFKFVF